MSGSPQSNGAAPLPLYSTRFKIVAAVLVTLVVVAIVIAVRKVEPGSQAGSDSTFVEALIPDRGSQLVQQGTVGIDLKSGWDGSLIINGTAIPDDDLRKAPSLNTLQFTPGPGKALRTLPVGNVCATAIVWPLATPKQTRPVNWCFEVI